MKTSSSLSSDPSFLALAITNWNPLPGGMTVTLTTSLVIYNAASAGHDAASVSGSDVNYDFTFRLSDVDESTDTDSLGQGLASHSVPSAQAQQGLSTSGFILVDAEVEVVMPMAECEDVAYLCVSLTEGAGASYVDSNAGNNIFCRGVATLKSCHPGMSLL